MTAQPIPRRHVLAGAVVLAGASVVTGLSRDRAVAAPVPQGQVWRGSTSANGWPITSRATLYRVEGTDHSVLLAPAAAPLLLHCLRRYHYEVDSTIQADEIVGHTTSRRIGEPFESNQLSGSAVAVRPTWYPLDATGGLFDHEVTIIRDIMADCEGLVRWGRDEIRPKESHFQIDVGPDDPALRSASVRFRQQVRTPGRGPGAVVDPFNASRIRRAQRVHDGQRRAR